MIRSHQTEASISRFQKKIKGFGQKSPKVPQNTEKSEGEPMELVQKLIDIESLLNKTEMDVEKAWAMCNELDRSHFDRKNDIFSVPRIENDIALEHTHTAGERLKQVDALMSEVFELAKAKEPAPEKRSKREAQPAEPISIEDDIEALVYANDMGLSVGTYKAVKDRYYKPDERDSRMFDANLFYTLGLMHGIRRERARHKVRQGR